MVKATCGCEYYFSNDHIIEFGRLCERHSKIYGDFIDLTRDIARKAVQSVVDASKLLGAWKIQ